MKFVQFLSVLFLLLLFTLPVTSQDSDPVFVIIKQGSIRPFDLAEQGIIDILSLYGYEDGLNATIIQYDGGFDSITNQLAAEDAIRQDPDIIFALSGPSYASIAAETAEIENPPLVLVGVSVDPVSSGLVEGYCDKPANTSIVNVYFPLLELVQSIHQIDPEISSFGFTNNPDQVASATISGIMIDIGEELGFTVTSRPISANVEVLPTLESMITSNRIEAITVVDGQSGFAMPDIVALANLAHIPVFSADAGQAYPGSTVNVGADYYGQGVALGRMGVAALNGDLDIATTSTAFIESIIVSVNLDSAAAQDVSIPETFLETVDFVIENGVSTELENPLEGITLDEELDLATTFFENLECETSDNDS